MRARMRVMSALCTLLAVFHNTVLTQAFQVPKNDNQVCESVYGLPGGELTFNEVSQTCSLAPDLLHVATTTLQLSQNVSFWSSPLEFEKQEFYPNFCMFLTTNASETAGSSACGNASFIPTQMRIDTDLKPLDESQVQCVPGFSGTNCSSHTFFDTRDAMGLLPDDEAFEELVALAASNTWCPYPTVAVTTNSWTHCSPIKVRCGVHGTPNASSVLAVPECVCDEGWFTVHTQPLPCSVRFATQSQSLLNYSCTANSRWDLDAKECRCEQGFMDLRAATGTVDRESGGILFFATNASRVVQSPGEFMLAGELLSSVHNTPTTPTTIAWNDTKISVWRRPPLLDGLAAGTSGILQQHHQLQDLPTCVPVQIRYDRHTRVPTWWQTVPIPSAPTAPVHVFLPYSSANLAQHCQGGSVDPVTGVCGCAVEASLYLRASSKHSVVRNNNSALEHRPDLANLLGARVDAVWFDAAVKKTASRPRIPTPSADPLMGALFARDCFPPGSLAPGSSSTQPQVPSVVDVLRSCSLLTHASNSSLYRVDVANMTFAHDAVARYQQLHYPLVDDPAAHWKVNQALGNLASSTRSDPSKTSLQLGSPSVSESHALLPDGFNGPHGTSSLAHLGTFRMFGWPAAPRAWHKHTLDPNAASPPKQQQGTRTQWDAQYTHHLTDEHVVGVRGNRAPLVGGSLNPLFVVDDWGFVIPREAWRACAAVDFGTLGQMAEQTASLKGARQQESLEPCEPSPQSPSCPLSEQFCTDRTGGQPLGWRSNTTVFSKTLFRAREGLASTDTPAVTATSSSQASLWGQTNGSNSASRLPSATQSDPYGRVSVGLAQLVQFAAELANRSTAIPKLSHVVGAVENASAYFSATMRMQLNASIAEIASGGSAHYPSSLQSRAAVLGLRGLSWVHHASTFGGFWGDLGSHKNTAGRKETGWVRLFVRNAVPITRVLVDSTRSLSELEEVALEPCAKCISASSREFEFDAKLMQFHTVDSVLPPASLGQNQGFCLVEEACGFFQGATCDPAIHPSAACTCPKGLVGPNCTAFEPFVGSTPIEVDSNAPSCTNGTHTNSYSRLRPVLIAGGNQGQNQLFANNASVECELECLANTIRVAGNTTNPQTPLCSLSPCMTMACGAFSACAWSEGANAGVGVGPLQLKDFGNTDQSRSFASLPHEASSSLADTLLFSSKLGRQGATHSDFYASDSNNRFGVTSQLVHSLRQQHCESSVSAILAAGSRSTVFSDLWRNSVRSPVFLSSSNGLWLGIDQLPANTATGTNATATLTFSSDEAVAAGLEREASARDAGGEISLRPMVGSRGSIPELPQEFEDTLYGSLLADFIDRRPLGSVDYSLTATVAQTSELESPESAVAISKLTWSLTSYEPQCEMLATASPLNDFTCFSELSSPLGGLSFARVPPNTISESNVDQDAYIELHSQGRLILDVAIDTQPQLEANNQYLALLQNATSSAAHNANTRASQSLRWYEITLAKILVATTRLQAVVDAFDTVQHPAFLGGVGSSFGRVFAHSKSSAGEKWFDISVKQILEGIPRWLWSTNQLVHDLTVALENAGTSGEIAQFLFRVAANGDWLVLSPSVFQQSGVSTNLVEFVVIPFADSQSMLEILHILNFHGPKVVVWPRTQTWPNSSSMAEFGQCLQSLTAQGLTFVQTIALGEQNCY